jgi:HEPN domain-containing protein
MHDPEHEARRWLRQAESDLLFARAGLRDGFFAQACFISQQAAEKAAKALHYLRGARFVPGHSVFHLLEPLSADDESLRVVLDAARQLDQYYIPARYPNGLPDGAPCDVFTRHQAQTAVQDGEAILARVRERLAGAGA